MTPADFLSWAHTLPLFARYHDDDDEFDCDGCGKIYDELLLGRFTGPAVNSPDGLGTALCINCVRKEDAIFAEWCELCGRRLTRHARGCPDEPPYVDDEAAVEAYGIITDPPQYVEVHHA